LQDLFLSLVMILGKQFKDWIYTCPLFDEYNDPDYLHQN